MGAEWDGLGGRSSDGECHFGRGFLIYVSDTPVQFRVLHRVIDSFLQCGAIAVASQALSLQSVA